MGKTDYDLAPAALAAKYCSDDARVLMGNSVNERLELITAEGQAGDWFLTSKWPIYDLQGHVIGSFGISRHLNRTEGRAIPFRELRTPITYINQHFASNMSVESLAGACGISVSALERRFKKHLNRTPHQYIIDVRLDNARRMLRDTDKPIGTIALETGFSDHSHFTRAFSRKFGLAPSRDLDEILHPVQRVVVNARCTSAAATGWELHAQVCCSLLIVHRCAHADQVVTLGIDGQHGMRTAGIVGRQIVAVDTADTPCPGLIRQ